MKKHLTIKELPDSERPYEKFEMAGAETLSDAELLAVMIRSGTNGKRAIDIAQEFLSTGTRNLLNLYEISYGDMQKIPGIGRVKAIQLKCIAELSRRIAAANYRKDVCFTKPDTIAFYYMERLRHEKQERLLVSMYDAKCHLLADTLLSIGSVSSSIAEPREIFLEALRHQAVHIVLLHNHPSGSPQPSKNDDLVTKRIAECGNMLGIMLADHIIIGDNVYYSYREHQRIL